MERNGAFQINKWIQCNTAGLLPTISHLGISHTNTAYTLLSYHIIHVDVTEKYANENVNDRWMASWMDDVMINNKIQHISIVLFTSPYSRAQKMMSHLELANASGPTKLLHRFVISFLWYIQSIGSVVFASFIVFVCVQIRGPHYLSHQLVCKSIFHGFLQENGIVAFSS